MMKTLWAVSSGSYSDYSVELLCVDKEVAEQVAAADSDSFVEGFSVWDGPLPEPVMWYTATVAMPVEATTIPEIEVEAQTYYPPLTEPWQLGRWDLRLFRWHSMPAWWRGVAHSPDRDLAVKALTDNIVQHVLSGTTTKEHFSGKLRR